MFLVGFSGLGSASSVSESYTSLKEMNNVSLKNGAFENLYMTKNTFEDYSIGEWNDDTIMSANYEKSLGAGNVDYILDEIDMLMVKKRAKGTYGWIPIYAKPVLAPSDFAINVLDWFCKNSTEYEYALVPCKNGTEGEYDVGSVISQFEGFVASDGNVSFRTIFDVKIDRDKNVPKSTGVTTLDSKYPYIVVNGSDNWDSVKASLGLLDYDYETDSANVYDNWEYRNSFFNFLSNKRPKVFKNEDGRIWIGFINGNPSEASGSHHYYPTISFQFDEVGSTESGRDLYENGLVDVEDWMVT